MSLPSRARPGAPLSVFALGLCFLLGGCETPGCSPELPVPQGHVELAGPVAPPGTPNVLIVLVDTTRADHLHFMGHERPTSPRMDAFAAGARVYPHHHSHSSRTGPSVASIFTGRYPGAHGVLNPLTHFDAKGRLAESQVTLAERLHEAGFATYGVVTNINASARFGFGQGFDVYEYFGDRDHGRHLNARAFELLDAHDSRTGPFFMYLHYMGPHSPYDPDPTHAGEFALSDYDGPIDGSHGQLDEIVGGQLQPDARDFDQLQRLYDEDVLTFDDRFGELMAGLRERDLLDRSIVILVADHGEEFGDHGSVLHGYTLYEEQLHVPFVMRLPGMREGERPDVVTRHVDVLPMLLDTLGLPPEPAAQGSASPGAPNTAEIFAQVQLRAVKTVRLRSLQLDAWKLIENQLPHPGIQLYDLAVDPHEQDDVSDREPERVEAMVTAMRRVDQANAGGEPPPEDLLTLTADEIAQLRALGYVGHGDDEPEGESPGRDDAPEGASPDRDRAP